MASGGVAAGPRAPGFAAGTATVGEDGVIRVDDSDSAAPQAFVDMLYHHLRRNALLEQPH